MGLVLTQTTSHRKDVDLQTTELKIKNGTSQDPCRYPNSGNIDLTNSERPTSFNTKRVTEPRHLCDSAENHQRNTRDEKPLSVHHLDKLPSRVTFQPVSTTNQHTILHLKSAMEDNLTIAYEKMDIFRSPLYMALSYEVNPGPLHSLLAQVLWEISTQDNASSVMLSREMRNKGFPVPTTATGNSTAQMNQEIRTYLQTLVNINLLQGPVSNDMVTTYRNYVVLYSLSEVINEATICVYNL